MLPGVPDDRVLTRPRDARRRVVPRDDGQLRRAGAAAGDRRAPGAHRRRRGRRPGRDLLGDAARAGRRLRRDAAPARRAARRPGGRLPAQRARGDRRLPRRGVDRGGVVLLRARLRHPRRPRPVRPDRAHGAGRRRRLPLQRQGLRPPGRRRRAARRPADRADDDRRPPALPGRPARRRAGLGRRRRRRAGAGVRVAALRPPAVDRLLVGHHGAAQGHRARARRRRPRAAQAGGAAHGRRRRRPVLLVRLDRLDHVEHRHVGAAHRRDGGGLRRRTDLSVGRRPVRPRRAHRHHLLRHQPRLPGRLREGRRAARASGTTSRAVRSIGVTGSPLPVVDLPVGLRRGEGRTSSSARCPAAPTSPPASSAARRCCR